jgi:Spy/CpxP family protein refolding chaperone
MKGNKGLFSMGFTVVMVLFIWGFGLPCFSQPPSGGSPRGADRPVRGGDESPQSIEKREKIRKRIELIRMWKLTEELDLTEETGAKLFPVLRKYDEKWIKLQEARRNSIKGLRKALNDEATPDEEIEAAIDNVARNAVAMSELLRQQNRELKGILSPRQRAKFILFQRRFQREIRRMIAEARERTMKARRNDRLSRD